MPGKSLTTKITHSSRVFPHKMDSGKPITTFSVSSVQIIAAETEVQVFPRPISSTTSAPGISASPTHLRTMNQMAQTWCARNLVPGKPGIEYFWCEPRSSLDWQIGSSFSSLTASLRHSCWNSLLIVLRSVLNTEMEIPGSSTSSPFCTLFWASLAPSSVFFSSSMISFSYSEISQADGLLLQHSWNSSRC